MLQFDCNLSHVNIHIHKKEAPAVLSKGGTKKAPNMKTAAWVTNEEVRPKPGPNWSPRWEFRQLIMLSYHEKMITLILHFVLGHLAKSLS